MKLKVLKQNGKSASELEVSDQLFAAKYNEDLIHQLVVCFQAGGRQGTRAQKNRAAVSGGGAKPWKQKGTGRARAGTIRSPIWRGGGRTFPATTRDFSQKLNKKMRRAGLRSIFSELVRQQRLVTVEEFKVDQPKTKKLVEQLKTLGIDNALIVTDQIDNNLALSVRNLAKIDVRVSANIDPVSLIAHDKVIMTTAALKQIEAQLA